MSSSFQRVSWTWRLFWGKAFPDAEINNSVGALSKTYEYEQAHLSRLANLLLGRKAFLVSSLLDSSSPLHHKYTSSLTPPWFTISGETWKDLFLSHWASKLSDLSPSKSSSKPEHVIKKKINEATRQDQYTMKNNVTTLEYEQLL